MKHRKWSSVYTPIKQITHSETNIAPENGGWNTTFLLGRPIFRCELLVPGRVLFVLVFIEDGWYQSRPFLQVLG